MTFRSSDPGRDWDAYCDHLAAQAAQKEADGYVWCDWCCEWIRPDEGYEDKKLDGYSLPHKKCYDEYVEEEGEK